MKITKDERDQVIFALTIYEKLLGNILDKSHFSSVKRRFSTTLIEEVKLRERSVRDLVDRFRKAKLES